jgi:hypothetical protein
MAFHFSLLFDWPSQRGRAFGFDFGFWDALRRRSVDPFEHPPGISGHVGEIHDHGSFLAATPAKRRLMRYSCHILIGIGNTHF